MGLVGGRYLFLGAKSFAGFGICNGKCRKEAVQQKAITTPFVLGAIIDLCNCLNLVESGSLKVVSSSYKELKDIKKAFNGKMPINTGNNRALDCAVIQYIHQTNKIKNNPEYDTVRCAFPEGEQAFPNSHITSRLHIQVCVRNPDCIKGFFLPRPLEKFNLKLR